MDMLIYICIVEKYVGQPFWQDLLHLQYMMHPDQMCQFSLFCFANE